MSPRDPVDGLKPQTTIGRIALLERQVRELAYVTIQFGSCDWGDCDGQDDLALRWSDQGWLKVCARHRSKS